MTEVFVTIDAIAPFLIERMFVFLIGLGMVIHFMLMSTSAPTKSSNSILLFMMAIAFAGGGMMATAIFGNISAMWTLLICGLGSMLLFWLWLWHEGLHVKDFLDKKYQ